MREKKALFLFHGGLTVLALSILLLPVGGDSFFGSEGDWYSQHVGAAEMLRQTMLEQHTLFPQFTTIGGGTNLYDFAYYGLFRPDVLVSCLAPELSMKYIIAGYAILGVAASVNLCFWWLRRGKGLEPWAAAMGAALMAASSCFFHAHHQIMFVNYMPFMILALAGVDRLVERGKSLLLIVSLFFLCLHSFYYAPACLVVCLFYFIYKQRGQGKELYGKAFLSVVTAVGIAAVLLLPSALAILSAEKDGGSFRTEPIAPVDLSLGGLLYQPYGCGLTLLAAYCLLLSLGNRQRRFLSAGILLGVMLPVVWLILNGFLYAREKILIPLLPLILLVCAATLQDLYQKKAKFLWLQALLCLIPAFFSSWKLDILADGAILLLWLALERSATLSETVKKRAFALLLIPPICVSIGVHGSESFLPAGDQRQSRFTREEVTDFAADSLYRFDVLANPLENANFLADGSIQKTSMYSSVSGGFYSRFFYDVIENPIQIRNRVALLPAANPAFLDVMGVRYILTREENLPSGYQIVEQKDGYVLAEKEDVLPVVYGTYEGLSEAAYETLSFPETIEALWETAIVPEGGDDTFSSSVQRADISLSENEDGEGSLTENSGPDLTDKILFLRFGVDSPKGEEVVIRIDGMTNKLSSKSAPYPNRNDSFTYVLDPGTDLDGLKVELSEGTYSLGQMESYLLDKNQIERDSVVIPTLDATWEKDGKTVFSGTLEMEKEGWLITSYPYREGYEIFVDGRKTELQKVNTAFLGCSLSAGSHHIEIQYVAPGFRTGLLLSAASLLLLLFVIWKERKLTK